MTKSAIGYACVYVCVQLWNKTKKKTNKPYNKQYNKSPDSTVYWDMLHVRVTDAAEIKQVSWIIQNVKSHSDSVPADALGLGSAQSQVPIDQLRPSCCWWFIRLSDLASFYLLIPTAMLSASTSSTLGKIKVWNCEEWSRSEI